MQAIEIKDTAPNLSGLKIKGRYVLLEEIGHGLMARAYLAYDELLEGEVVVKVINTEIGGVPIPLGPEWTLEAKRAMKVRGCPYIASVTDFGEEKCEIDGCEQVVPYIVWERVFGKTLQEHMEENREIDERMIIATMIQLLQVLIALKKNNLIHGDLHVKNVMYDMVSASRFFVKVIDFGLANLIASEADFKRDRKSVGKVIGQILDAYEQQHTNDTNTLFKSEIQKLCDEIAAPKVPTLEELLQYLAKAEELERKFLLGAEWFHTRSKNKPIGLEPHQYLRHIKRDDEFPIVGAEEMSELQKWIKNGLDEDLGRVLALKGEVGLGKSRWSLELLEKVANDETGAFIMRTATYPGDHDRPLEPIKRMWRSFLGETEHENYKAFISDMFPEIPLLVEPLTDLLMPKTAEQADSMPALDELNCQKLVVTGFKHLALKAGLIISIDDIHYADDQTLNLIKDLSMATGRYPIVLLFTFNKESDGKFQDLLQDLARRDNFLQYELRELTFAQTNELLLSRYPWNYKEDARKLTDVLYPQVGGNPFYIFEMLKFLESREYICRESGAAILKPGFDLKENPRSVQSLMLERINTLSPEYQKIVRMASILGSEFTTDYLAEICNMPVAVVENIIRHLHEDHRIFIKTDDRYSFAPHMLYDVVYSSIPEEETQEKHLAAAEVLRAKVHHNPKLNAMIAEHLLKSGARKDVAEYYLKAARHALKVNLKSQAEEWCQSGMRILDESHVKDDRLLGKFFLLKGVLSRQAGDAEGYRENTYNAYNCAVLSRDQNLEGKSLKALGEYYRSIADYRASIDYFQSGLNVLKRVGDHREVALILKELSINFCFMGDFEQAIKVLNESKEISEELNDREGMARIYNNMGLIYKILGDLSVAKEWLERSIRLFREIDDAQGEVLPIGNMAIIYTEEGEFERAMILLREITSSEARLSDTRIKAKVHVTLGDVLFELGEYNETMEYYERALMVFRALGDRQGECETLTNMAFTCLEQNKNKLAENYSRLALQIKQEIGYERGIPYNYLINTRLARLDNNFEDALGNIKTGMKTGSAQSGWLKLAFLLEQALINDLKQDKDSAEKCFTQIEEIIRANPEKIPPTFQVLFFYRYGVFLSGRDLEDESMTLIAKSMEILGSLERKIFQAKWREKFRSKYVNILGMTREVGSTKS